MPDRPTLLNDRDATDIVDAIQPHGAMLVTRVDDWLVTHASANLEAFLGRTAGAVLGRPLRDAIGDEACAALRSIEPGTSAGPSAVQLSITGKAGRTLHVRAHRLGCQVCIDLEPADPNAGTKSPLVLTQPVLDSFQNATSSAELCDLAVRGLQAITGYHRVMMYVFDESGDGVVVAESCAPPMQPCLGLRISANDIPSGTRQQFLRQRIGIVPDAEYTPVPVLADSKRHDHLPIDMTYSQLRNVPLLQRAHLRRMRTAGSLTIGLADGENLWGVLACHHAVPCIAGTELRAAANVIGQVVSLLHGSLRQADLSTQRLRRNTMLRTLVDRLASSGTLPAALEAVQAELLQLIDAAGFIVRLSGTTLAFGQTPEPPAAEQIVTLLQADADGEILAVDDMESRYAHTGLPMPCCYGALLAPLSYGADDAILWVRAEQCEAGNSGGGRASPRSHRPYESPDECAKHRSLPWSDADIALAAEVARRLEAEIVRRTKAELARAQDASRAKSRFLAGMTHELRTPLHGILGYAQLLSTEGGLNDLQAMRVHAMMGAGTHLLEMINRVLELSEIESEQVKLCLARLEVRSVVAACLDVVRPNAEAKGLALTVSVAPGIDTAIITDSMRLRQVLLNLLGNAVKFTASGAIDVRLAQAETASSIRIEVADTGPGIPAGQRTRLFQDFERLQDASLAGVEGAGLGLALSARLAALMGGCMGYEPGQSGGSVFWLELPYGTKAPDEASGADAPPASADTLPVTPLHVLVVDDVAINRGIAECFLRAAGHDVTAVGGGAEALLTLQREAVDVVLMDVRMPGMDGLEATRRIRALGGRNGDVPVVALTAQAFADQVEACQKAGMQDHLAKPFSPNMLVAAVTRAAKRRIAGHKMRPGRRAAASAQPAPPGLRLPEPEPTDMPLIDRETYQATASYLSAAAVARYLQTMMLQGTKLLAGLRANDASTGHLRILAELAHNLAGSAGMFGFARVAHLGRQFERAVLTSASDVSALGASLDRATDATLRDIADRLEAGNCATQMAASQA